MFVIYCQNIIKQYYFKIKNTDIYNMFPGLYFSYLLKHMILFNYQGKSTCFSHLLYPPIVLYLKTMSHIDIVSQLFNRAEGKDSTCYRFLAFLSLT